jgi:hypothetical protein
MSKLLDWVSEFLAHRKGLLPLTGMLLIVVNLILQFMFAPFWLTTSNLFLHIGLIIAIIGLMLAWAL